MILFKTLLILACVITCQSLSAKVYPTIDRIQPRSGTLDCYIIDYSLWDDHGTLSPADDSNVGSYSAVVGTDCTIYPDEPSLPEYLYYSNDESIQIGNSVQISVYPNPVVEELSVKVNDPSIIRKWEWIILTNNNRILLTGVKSKADKEDLKINIEDLPSGSYYIVLISDKFEVSTEIFTIIK